MTQALLGLPGSRSYFLPHYPAYVNPDDGIDNHAQFQHERKSAVAGARGSSQRIGAAGTYCQRFM